MKNAKMVHCGLKSLFRAVGFSEREIVDAAFVLKHVRDEPGLHLFRFNGHYREIVFRLVKLGLILRLGKDNCELMIPPKIDAAGVQN
jgi:hypothetical protein